MSKDRKGMGCLAKALISILVVVVIVVVACVALLHLTPNHFKLGDVQIAGTSINELGLGDTKFIDIIKSFFALKKPDESAIVTNAPTAEDKSAVADKIETGSSIDLKEDGTPDFSSIATDPVIYDKEYLISYSDKELAGLFQNIISDAKAKADAPDSIKFLADLDATIASITIYNKSNSKADIRIVAKISLGSLKEEILKNLPAFLGNQLPDTVFIATYGTISANVAGDVIYTHVDCLINDKDDALSTAIFKVIANRASLEQSQDPKAAVGNKVGAGFKQVVGNLGKVGTADADDDGVVTSGKALGKDGIHNGYITVITQTA
jgi:hypothetical protein